MYHCTEDTEWYCVAFCPGMGCRSPGCGLDGKDWMRYDWRKGQKRKMNWKKKLGLLLLFCLIAAGAVTAVNKRDSLAASKQATVTANTLNVRSGPGTKYDIVQVKGANVYLKKGEVVTIIKKSSNNWYQISCKFGTDTVKGYVLGDYLKTGSTSSGKEDEKETTTEKPASSGNPYSINAKVTASSLNVRKKASTSADQTTVSGTKVKLVKGAKVKILNTKKSGNAVWYYISGTFNKKAIKGYVHSDYVEITDTSVKAEVNSSSKVKIRTGAGSSKSYLKIGGSVCSLSDGKSVTIKDEKTVSGVKWFYISFKVSDKTYKGYIEASKIQFKDTRDKDEPADETTTEGTTETTTESPDDRQMGKTTADTLNVRTGYGTSYDKLTYKSKTVQLKKNTEVEILGSKKVSGTTWYKIAFTYSGADLEGYVSGDYIRITETEKPEEPDDPDPEDPDDGKDPGNDTPMSDAEFEEYMTAQGFPESYKPYLRTLHASHPTWTFEAYHTNKDWSAVIANESVPGKNLITNSRGISFKSFEAGCYDYAIDKFTVYDGSTWVTASKMATEYYMDPRNWLRESYVYQFETLSYDEKTQTKDGVEAILANTAFANKSFTYTNDSGKQVTMKYSEAILAAAEYSGVSPYHLASRIKQEVVTGTTSVSGSVTGTYSGYEGYYNFYNIGATNSAGGGAIANGLKFAKNGTTSAAKNATYLIPWDNPYDAIVGGAFYIGSTYIQKGQNTIYLQKFNVTNTSTYTHQYMSNIEAPYAEAAKVKAAYMAIGEMPLKFSIPVYLNMPSSACPSPSGVKNPNNWLSDLQVFGYSLSPAFDAKNAEGTIYTVTVPYSTYSVIVSGVPAASSASVSGNGTVILNDTVTAVSLVCTSESGASRTYTLQIIKQ